MKSTSLNLILLPDAEEEVALAMEAAQDILHLRRRVTGGD